MFIKYECMRYISKQESEYRKSGYFMEYNQKMIRTRVICECVYLLTQENLQQKCSNVPNVLIPFVIFSLV